ncbi:MAG: trypsin-like peptidase domain-containing protein [Bacilli bacterium]|nr:trypsin-like peptidase domain-containing protein [Bacilli bacterium]
MKKNYLSIIFITTIVISFSIGAICTNIVLHENNNSNNKYQNKSTSITLKEEESINEAISNIYDAVVVIEGYKKEEMVSTGTGFIYKKDDKEAYIMTNHHVVSECDKVKVILSDKTEIDATISGSEAYSDIAVLKTKNDKIEQIVNIGKSETLKIGDTLFAIGSPEGVDYAGTVTKGILSGKDRLVEVALNNSTTSDYYMKVLQTDVAINPGNSGGPLCNIKGEVIGITNMKLVNSTIEGMGFAIPIEDALHYAKILEKGEKIKRPYIGISMIDRKNELYLWENRITIPNNIKNGIIIVEVNKDSPASKAKLEKGDIITRINNKDINSLAEFRYELFKYNVGEEIKITYIRNKKKKKVQIKLTEKSD